MKLKLNAFFVECEQYMYQNCQKKTLKIKAAYFSDFKDSHESLRLRKRSKHIFKINEPTNLYISIKKT